MKPLVALMVACLFLACGQSSQNRGKPKTDAGISGPDGPSAVADGRTEVDLRTAGADGGFGGTGGSGQDAGTKATGGGTGETDAAGVGGTGSGTGGTGGGTGGVGGASSSGPGGIGGTGVAGGTSTGATSVIGGTGGSLDGGNPDRLVIPVDANVVDVAADVAADTAIPPADAPVADTAPPCTPENAIQCGATGVETCTAGAWIETQSCPQGCSANQCNTGPVTCRAGEVACFGSSVKVCNLTGSAWLSSMVCADRCQNGLCVGTCTPNAHRCNGSTRQVCNAGGSAWVDDTVCTQGCNQTVCIEGAHANQGNVETLEGPHSYQGCFTMELGGSVSVPANKTLEIWATCFSMTSGTTVSLGTGASFIVHAADTINLAGTINGGSLVNLMAWNALNDAGTIKSGTVILRADNLHYQTGATVTGTSAALYGASFVNDAAFPGTISVMPPETVSSVNAPDSGWWNWSPSGLDISWPRPFPGAIGYYVSVGDTVPGPGNGRLTVTEHIVLPADSFSTGTNRIRVVSVNPTSLVGTYTTDMTVVLNITPPIVTSSSHPIEGQWYTTPDLFMSWTDPAGAPAGSFAGYRYILDHAADTLPTATTGTFTTQKQTLMPGQASGIWFFHIVNVDRLGRTTPVAAHYQVRIGEPLATGNIAGHIQAEDGTPLAGVHVSIAGGLLHAYSATTGDYSFLDQVPASSLAYMVTAAMPGYAMVSGAVQVSAGATAVKNFTLPAGTTPSYRLGVETPLYTGSVGLPTFAMGPRDRIIWSSSATQASSKILDAVTIARTSGDAILTDSTLYGPASAVPTGSASGPTDVGWDGTRFYALDNFGCSAYQNTITAGETGIGCVQMRDYDMKGQALSAWKGWGVQDTGLYDFSSLYTGAGVWNGSGYGAFFIAITRPDDLGGSLTWRLGVRDLSSSMVFTDGKSASAINTIEAVVNHWPGAFKATRVRALWDGTNYALVHAVDNCTFERFDVSHTRVGSAAVMDACVEGASIGLVFTGSGYHSSYVKTGTTNALVLRALGSDGSLGSSTTVADLGVGGMGNPVLAFDRRNLLLTYQGATNSVLEIRAPGDQALVKSIDLGAVTLPQVSFNPQTAQGGVVYVRNGTLYFRSLFAD